MIGIEECRVEMFVLKYVSVGMSQEAGPLRIDLLKTHHCHCLMYLKCSADFAVSLLYTTSSYS